jgi:hypothetical protein
MLQNLYDRYLALQAVSFHLVETEEYKCEGEKL